MIPAIKQALKKDILFEPPPNYMAGQGDTYFSGKILAKLGRILIIANEVGGVSPQAFRNAVTRLREGVEIWLNGSAASSMLYDRSWGGIIMCGCNYFYDEVEKKTGCYNKFPDCPAITDPGQNFGAGYYNDHHYHFGYHIYAAAVVAKFDPFWGRKYYQHVMMLVRDISNPSDDDKYFPTWRHKDWYLGWSWASGIVTIGGKPYPNGRNQESVSEAISAYEAVALYGEVMVCTTTVVCRDQSMMMMMHLSALIHSVGHLRLWRRYQPGGRSADADRFPGEGHGQAADGHRDPVSQGTVLLHCCRAWVGDTVINSVR